MQIINRLKKYPAYRDKVLDDILYKYEDIDLDVALTRYEIYLAHQIRVPKITMYYLKTEEDNEKFEQIFGV